MESYQILSCLCLLLFCILNVGQSEIFTAFVDLEKVLLAENDVARNIRLYIEAEEQRLNELRRIADDYEAHSHDALQDVLSHLGNPVNAFLLIKRFTSDWDKVEALIKNNTSDGFLQSIHGTLDVFPDGEDLEGAATALLRLQDTYALPTHKLARGEIQGVKHSPELTAEDCFELGKLAYEQGDHYHCMMWMEEALELYEKQPEMYPINKALLLDYFSFSAYQQGNPAFARELTLQWLELEPDHQRAQSNLLYYEQLLAQEQEDEESAGDKGETADEIVVQNERPLSDYRASEEFQVYEALCRGEETHVIPGANSLLCRYRSDIHPYFILRPLKEEMIYHDPPINIYHDIITNAQIEKVKELAAPKLKRATVQNPSTGNLETAYYRVSKSAWLSDSDDRLIADITSKVHFITGLTMDTAEELQVVNYGIGGHYEPHFDFSRDDEESKFDIGVGNRIATAIYYMTDVEAGGATVFPVIGVKLWPIKGTLAVWMNLRKSGEGDHNTRHAACPVLTGQKWICNKWLHERGQEFVRPCSTDPLE